MTEKFYTLNFDGYKTKLPIMKISPDVEICFFNLHGNCILTEICANLLCKQLKDCDVLLTVESKGLQLTHCIARNLGQEFYAVARKSMKLYIQDGIHIEINPSVTTGKKQDLYLSAHDAALIKGKKVGIVDDVISSGASLSGLEKLVEAAGGIIHKKAFVLAEGDAVKRKDVIFLKYIPLFIKNKAYPKI